MVEQKPFGQEVVSSNPADTDLFDAMLKRTGEPSRRESKI